MLLEPGEEKAINDSFIYQSQEMIQYYLMKKETPQWHTSSMW
jgi:hypothetical protein